MNLSSTPRCRRLYRARTIFLRLPRQRSLPLPRPHGPSHRRRPPTPIVLVYNNNNHPKPPACPHSPFPQPHMQPRPRPHPPVCPRQRRRTGGIRSSAGSRRGVNAGRTKCATNRPRRHRYPFPRRHRPRFRPSRLPGLRPAMDTYTAMDTAMCMGGSHRRGLTPVRARVPTFSTR